VSERITVTVPDGLNALVEGLVRYSGTTEEVPTLSKARVLRLLAYDGANSLVEGELDVLDEELAEEGDVEALLELIPEHVRARYLREEVKEENWLADMKGGFEGRGREMPDEPFRNGYEPDAAAEVAEGLIKEARIYWIMIEDDAETFERKQQYVHDKIDEYRERHEETTWDHDEDWLGGFEGVQDGRDREVIAESAVEIAEDVADRIRGGARDRQAVVDAVSKKYGVDEERVWQLVRSIMDGRRDEVPEDVPDPDQIPGLGGASLND
jgi:hypothetical protein